MASNSAISSISRSLLCLQQLRRHQRQPPYRPTIPDKFRGPTNGRVTFESISAVGANSVVLRAFIFPKDPGSAHSTLAHRSLEPWTLYLGVPMRKLKRTSPRLKGICRRTPRTDARGVLRAIDHGRSNRSKLAGSTSRTDKRGSSLIASPSRTPETDRPRPLCRSRPATTRAVRSDVVIHDDA